MNASYLKFLHIGSTHETFPVRCVGDEGNPGVPDAGQGRGAGADSGDSGAAGAAVHGGAPP